MPPTPPKKKRKKTVNSRLQGSRLKTPDCKKSIIWVSVISRCFCRMIPWIVPRMPMPKVLDEACLGPPETSHPRAKTANASWASCDSNLVKVISRHKVWFPTQEIPMKKWGSEWSVPPEPVTIKYFHTTLLTINSERGRHNSWRTYLYNLSITSRSRPRSLQTVCEGRERDTCRWRPKLGNEVDTTRKTGGLLVDFKNNLCCPCDLVRERGGCEQSTWDPHVLLLQLTNKSILFEKQTANLSIQSEFPCFFKNCKTYHTFLLRVQFRTKRFTFLQGKETVSKNSSQKKF